MKLIKVREAAASLPKYEVNIEQVKEMCRVSSATLLPWACTNKILEQHYKDFH